MYRRLLATATVGLVLGQSIGFCADSDIPKPKGNLRYSVSVAEFKNEANWSHSWDIGDGFKTIFTDSLQQSGWFIVLADGEMRKEAMAEQDLGASGRTAGGKKTAKVGRLTPAQLLVRGSITHVANDTGGGGGRLNFKGISLGGSGGKAEINITIYLMDTSTGQVKASTKVVGQSGRKGLSFGYSGSKLGGLTGDVDAYKKDNVGKACEDACGQALQFLIKQLDKLPWEASILSVSGEKIIINRGSREGIEVGSKFDVGTTEELVDDDTGEVLDVEMKKAGQIEVTEVKEKIAYCKPLSGGSKLTKEMSAFPVKE
jgi:curli biogenesis system outer membrane secretion channel CsgG